MYVHICMRVLHRVLVILQCGITAKMTVRIKAEGQGKALLIKPTLYTGACLPRGSVGLFWEISQLHLTRLIDASLPFIHPPPINSCWE